MNSASSKHCRARASVSQGYHDPTEVRVVLSLAIGTQGAETDHHDLQLIEEKRLSQEGLHLPTLAFSPFR
jgi:hypothetical protein